VLATIAGAAAAALALAAPAVVGAQRPFAVTDSSVRQGPFTAVALSRDTIVSTYPRAAREVRFKFSIDGRENEFPPGTEHTIYLRPRQGRLVTPLYTFGDESEPPPPTPEQSAGSAAGGTGGSEEGTAQVTFRVDLRPVRRAIAERGAYVTPTGARLTRGDVRAVYVVGDPAPLDQRYDALRPGSPLELTDADGDGIYEGTVPIATAYTRPRAADGRALWTRTLDLAAFPALTSPQRLQDALYRMSLEELRQLVRPDGALSAGAKWEGVWTRDVSLASILSLAFVAPTPYGAASRPRSTRRGASSRTPAPAGRGRCRPTAWCGRSPRGRCTPPRATPGGSARAYDVTRRSALADLHAARDPETRLFRGETSFMDWREQSYPRWMQPADIYRRRG
jgi:hypothetical protein